MHTYVLLYLAQQSPLNRAPWFRPVDDAFGVQEHESGGYLCCVEPCSGLLELPGLLDVEHKIATIHKLHHKEETVLPKEAKGMTFIHVHTNHTRFPCYYTVQEPMTMDMLRLLQGWYMSASHQFHVCLMDSCTTHWSWESAGQLIKAINLPLSLKAVGDMWSRKSDPGGGKKYHCRRAWCRDLLIKLPEVITTFSYSWLRLTILWLRVAEYFPWDL